MMKHFVFYHENNPEQGVVRGQYLGGVKVQVIILLVGSKILVLVIGGGSYEHHPVAIIFTAGVKTHHLAVPLEDLPIENPAVT